MLSGRNLPVSLSVFGFAPFSLSPNLALLYIIFLVTSAFWLGVCETACLKKAQHYLFIPT